MRAALFVLALLAGLAGCDQIGIESSAAVAARREAEGKAVGGGCRHAARSVEQCYEQNKRADKAAVFAGWREMNDYMRENKIDSQPPASEAQSVDVAAAETGESKDAESSGDADNGKPSDNAGANKRNPPGRAGKAAKPAQ